MNIYLSVICALAGYWHSAVIIQPDEAQDRAAIVASVRSYVQAFNERDAKAVSQHWSADGELLEPNGSLLIGKAAIQDSFEKLFAGLLPSQTLSIRIERISFVTPDVAIEEGTAYVVDAWQTEYAATHKKENGRWVIHSVRESTISEVSSHYDHLQPLEWMLGDWIDESEEATIESSCNWSKNRNFIRRNFRVSVPGMEPLEGTQIIGYDAASGNIRSWIFDSDGGWGSGIWSPNDDGWEVRSNQVLADGRTATATNYYQRIDDNQFQWTSRQRQIGSNDLPDTKPVIVQRVAQDRNGN